MPSGGRRPRREFDHIPVAAGWAARIVDPRHQDRGVRWLDCEQQACPGIVGSAGPQLHQAGRRLDAALIRPGAGRERRREFPDFCTTSLAVAVALANPAAASALIAPGSSVSAPARAKAS